MSIDISWPTLTSGPDGDLLAAQIRDFIHEKFQNIALPRFIQSVQVHSFDFGSVAPDVELKDIGDPLGDFYEALMQEEGRMVKIMKKMMIVVRVGMRTIGGGEEGGRMVVRTIACRRHAELYELLEIHAVQPDLRL